MVDRSGQQDNTSRASECLGREGGKSVGLGREREEGLGIWAPGGKLGRPPNPSSARDCPSQSSLGP